MCTNTVFRINYLLEKFSWNKTNLNFSNINLTQYGLLSLKNWTDKQMTNFSSVDARICFFILLDWAIKYDTKVSYFQWILAKRVSVCFGQCRSSDTFGHIRIFWHKTRGLTFRVESKPQSVSLKQEHKHQIISRTS